MRVLLVDPSLFTGPYDGALNAALITIGIEPLWATRPLRRGDRHEIPPAFTDPFFYRWIDEGERLPPRLRVIAKGFAHVAGLLELIGKVRRSRPDVVHVQWLVLPLLDTLALHIIRRWAPVVITIHDTVPFNGQSMSVLQTAALDAPLKLADRLIVHTKRGQEALKARGASAEKIAVVPHGPLRLPRTSSESPPPSAFWTCLLFGELKPYKGIDILVEAVGQMPLEDRDRCRFIVAGRPRMSMDGIVEKISALGLQNMFDLRLHRQSDDEMAALFDTADCVVFPYRQIDASGVYYLVKGSGKWLIASDVGVFAEDLRDGLDGDLVPPGDIPAFSQALVRGIGKRCSPRTTATDWIDIAETTQRVYEAAIASHRAGADHHLLQSSR